MKYFKLSYTTEDNNIMSTKIISLESYLDTFSFITIFLVCQYTKNCLHITMQYEKKGQSKALFSLHANL